MEATQLPLETCPQCGAQIRQAVNAQTGTPYRYCGRYPQCVWIEHDAPPDAILRKLGQPTLFDETPQE